MSEGRALSTRKELSTVLHTPAVRTRFDEMLGKRSAAFISSIISAVNSNQYLRDCEPMSVVSAAAVAASMDLPINPSLGFAHIVPYDGSAQFQIGWKGFVQLAMRSGQYKTINITPVYEGQIKKHNPFTGEMEFDSSVVSEKTAGYLLYFKLLNGYEKYFYMTKDQCLAHGKKYSRSFKKGKGVWVDDFDSMALKTVAKLGLSKYGILSVDMQRAIELDQAEVDENMNTKYIDAESQVTDSPAEAINKKIRAKKSEVVQPAPVEQSQAPLAEENHF